MKALGAGTVNLAVLGLGVCALGALLTAAPAWAEVFVLQNGGRIEGELLNPDETPRRSYRVRVADGAEITLSAAQVDQVLHVRPEEEQYEQIRPSYPDTPDAQWALAEWCREQGLLEQRDRHLERSIELDPDNVDARRALGYSQFGGEWKKQQQVMAERGMILYKGRWLTQQQIDVLENKRKIDLAEKEWYQKIKRWRGWLGTDKDALARQNLAAINDPAAVAALVSGLKADTVPAARVIYAELLAKLGGPGAIRALAESAIEDPNQEVRLSCLDYLEKLKSPDAVAYFVSKLRSKDNVVVNRAGLALGRMGNASAVGPLIDALVTTHKYKVTTGNPGQMSVGFPTGGSGGGGLAVGGSTRIITRQLANQAVLDALVGLTGMNFNFEQRAWKYWYAARKQPAAVDARRD
jgi:hypothetical protein